MIDTKDLRVGNVVLIKGKPTVIDSIHENYVNIIYSLGDYGGGCGYDYFDEAKDINAMPITHEILNAIPELKYWACPWRNDNYHWEVESNWIILIDKGDGDYWPYLSEEAGYELTQVPIKYLHELQNWYKSFCSKDLTIRMS